MVGNLAERGADVGSRLNGSNRLLTGIPCCDCSRGRRMRLVNRSGDEHFTIYLCDSVERL